jgi:sulfite reductase beta subunit-like hemoprotein
MSSKETHAERIKREKDGLDVLADIVRYAQTGFSAIEQDDSDRFKWYGLYTQRPAEEGFFMMRVRVPGGQLTADQLETLGRLSVQYARSTGDITTRQCIQLHYIRIEDVPHIFAELDKAGLTTQETCGDVVRNVVGSPLAGIDTDELIDATPIVQQLSHQFLNDKAFSNLPRKFKVSVSGSARHHEQHEINDIGLIAVRNMDGEIGFDLWVGGGLGAIPHLGKRLGAFVTAAEIPEVVTRIVEIFRDHGPRENRRKARMKFLVAAWGVEKFRAELEKRLGRALRTLEAVTLPEFSQEAYFGIHPQKNQTAAEQLYYIGTATLRGRFSGEQMLAVANLARRYAGSRVRLTNTQNLILPDVPEQNILTLETELATLELKSASSAFRRGTVSCTGQQFCKLAVVETKDRAANIIQHLENSFPDFRHELRISVTGCVNSCAQYQIADVGLVGVKGQENGEEVDFFQIHLGGHFGGNARFGRKLSKRVRAGEIHHYLERIVRAYLAHREDDEKFYQFVARHQATELEDLDNVLQAAVSEENPILAAV